MLNENEKGFVEYWEQNRLRKKKVWRYLSAGLPLGVALAGAILVNIYSGWNKAGTVLGYDVGQFIIVLIAIILIVVFVVIFSAYHRWDMNEQHYKELLAKKDKS